MRVFHKKPESSGIDGPNSAQIGYQRGSRTPQSLLRTWTQGVDALGIEGRATGEPGYVWLDAVRPRYLASCPPVEQGFESNHSNKASVWDMLGDHPPHRCHKHSNVHANTYLVLLL